MLIRYLRGTGRGLEGGFHQRRGRLPAEPDPPPPDPLRGEVHSGIPEGPGGLGGEEPAGRGPPFRHDRVGNFRRSGNRGRAPSPRRSFPGGAPRPADPRPDRMRRAASCRRGSPRSLRPASQRRRYACGGPSRIHGPRILAQGMGLRFAGGRRP
ncbi:MAG: hypothetical protein M0C28_21990 [Candidatus Moduliflexus flocculans]|nr:hypothetical protein [Candidatus Moduliflexus flocculans]